MPAALGEADRRRASGVGHRDDHIGVDGDSSRQPLAHLVPRRRTAAAVDARVGPGEVDVLEDAQRTRCAAPPPARSGRRRSSSTTSSPGASSRSRSRRSMSSAHVSEASTQRVVEAADHQRPDAVRDRGSRRRRSSESTTAAEGPLDLRHRVGDGDAQRAPGVLRDQRRDHLGVRGRVAAARRARAAPRARSACSSGCRCGPARWCGRRRAARSAGRSATRSSRWSSSAHGRSRCGRAGPTASARRTPG